MIFAKLIARLKEWLGRFERKPISICPSCRGCGGEDGFYGTSPEWFKCTDCKGIGYLNRDS